MAAKPAATAAAVQPAATTAPVAKPAASPPQKPAVPPEWEQTVAAAKKEGTLNLMASGGASVRDTLMEFQKAYPEIRIE